ncbi:hypothetical protein [Streptomyces sp. NPDC057301]|uniref:hypothetical protein n=1 Tax=Streptomyces sp. NPDC057301 TaxID=3346093 RepID=UPI00363B83C3
MSDALARSRLSKSELAVRVQLGRTTVSEAFNLNAPVPSADTVSALVRVLKLPVDELLELRRRAAEEVSSSPGSDLAPGRLIGMWEPHDLEVHPAGSSPDGRGSRVPERQVLSAYVQREHDRLLADAVHDCAEGRSRMLVLVGSSSTGKTRSCWEAVQPLAERDWRLWHPFDPTRAEAALEDLHRVQPRTVVWLNEAQHYLGDPKVGERIAAAIHTLLTQTERGPVLVLGTLWPEFAGQYTSLPAPGAADPHSRVRELLTRRTVAVPEAFDPPALAAAAALATDGDQLLADALTRTRTTGRLTQDLAGAPELLDRYEHATPAARAVLEAAMDARRLGVGLHLPQAFLTAAAFDYLTDADYDRLANDWAEAAFAELARPVHGKQAPLHRVNPRPRRRPPGPSRSTTGPLPPGAIFRLADYLEQHGWQTRRWLCPPASFWHAAHTHFTSLNDLERVVEAAEERHRLEWAHHLRLRAADAGSTLAQVRLGMLWEAAEDTEAAETLYRQAADAGDTDGLVRLAMMREAAGEREAAEALARQAANAGNTDALHSLAIARERAGQPEIAEALARHAADVGKTDVLRHLAEFRRRSGGREGSEALIRQQPPDTGVLFDQIRAAAVPPELAKILRTIDIRAGFLDSGDPDDLVVLADLQQQIGDREGAEALYRQAADAGSGAALPRLAVIRGQGGDLEGAATLARQAAKTGSTSALMDVAGMRQKAGDREDAEALYRQAADAGSRIALIRAAGMWEDVGNAASADALLQQCTNAGETSALLHPAWISWAEERQLVPAQRWPYGLDPDGRPSAPWDPLDTMTMPKRPS